MNFLPPVALLLVALAAPVAAQVDSAATPERAGRVLTHTFTTPGREFVRVRLESGQTYRVQVDAAHASLEIRPLSQGVQAPAIQSAGMRQGRVQFDVRPRVSAEYELRVLSPGAKPVRLTIDRRS